MDWTKQSEDMLKSWTDTQKKMWDNWLEMMQQGPSQAQAAQVWQKTIETWEETVNSTLAAQGEWTKMWMDSLDTKNMPEETVQWAKQAEDMSQKWAEAQKQMWQGWFDMLKQADVTKMVSSWEGEGQKAFQNWQDSAKQIMDTQMNWLNMWTPGQVEVKTKAKK
jgi:hypothetical protein